MRMKVDGALCSGHSRCWKYAPAVFALDDQGYNLAVGGQVEVPAGEEKAAEMGMKACPERAISIAD